MDISAEKDVIWSDGRDFSVPCTANDFVFAFERLFKPETRSERASEYFVIKNSQAINNGSEKDLSQLGVKAIDEYTLQITLEKPCSDFAQLMALPPAMPCNREYYDSTQGRYGLSAECIASNSGYYVHTQSFDKWSDDNNYFILKRNYENDISDSHSVGINLFIDPVDERKYFDEEVIQAYNTSSTEEISELKKKFRYSEYKTDVWGIIFNLDGELSELNYRSELAKYIDYSEDNEIYTAYNFIIPYCADISGVNYRESAG